MKPTIFPEYNRTLLAPEGDTNGVVPLKVWSDGTRCISCWKMSWKERLSALFFGRLWIDMLSGWTQPPVYPQASKDYFTLSQEEKARRRSGTD